MPREPPRRTVRPPECGSREVITFPTSEFMRFLQGKNESKAMPALKVARDSFKAMTPDELKDYGDDGGNWVWKTCSRTAISIELAATARGAPSVRSVDEAESLMPTADAQQPLRDMMDPCTGTRRILAVALQGKETVARDVFGTLSHMH